MSYDTYIINLKQDTDKYKRMKIRLQNIGLKHTRFDAINGKYIKDRYDDLIMNKEFIPRSAIGCALSHYQVIEGAYNSGYENVLILEEDFYLNKEFSKFPVFELNHLDDDWSICYLGRSPLEKDKEESVNESIVRCKYTFNTHAYMISRKGMKEILDSDPFHGVYSKWEGNKIMLCSDVCGENKMMEKIYA